MAIKLALSPGCPKSNLRKLENPTKSQTATTLPPRGSKCTEKLVRRVSSCHPKINKPGKWWTSSTNSARAKPCLLRRHTVGNWASSTPSKIIISIAHKTTTPQINASQTSIKAPKKMSELTWISPRSRWISRRSRIWRMCTSSESKNKKLLILTCTP